MFASPHGVFPYGGFLTILLWRQFISYPFLGCAADVLFYIPIIKQVFAWVGVIPANKQLIKSSLENEHAIGVTPGGLLLYFHTLSLSLSLHLTPGIAEIFEVGNLDETLIMNNRKGLIRIALQTGTQIVPCYIFGNTQLYSLFKDEGYLCLS